MTTLVKVCWRCRGHGFVPLGWTYMFGKLGVGFMRPSDKMLQPFRQYDICPGCNGKGMRTINNEPTPQQ